VRTVLGAPDILAVQEVENLDCLTSLAAKIQADDPSLAYSTHLIEGNDTSGIDVGYLTRNGRVTVDSLDQFGEDLLLSIDSSLLYDRPPLVLEATLDSPATDPMPLTVINVHQRSLNGIDGPNATYVKTKRHEQAAELADFVQSLQDATPAIHLLTTGDFNAHEFTDGYVDVLGQISGDLDPLGDEIGTTDTVDPDLFNWTKAVDAAERYSYVFEGSAMALDHALSSRFLTPRVRRAELARGNADAPYAYADDETTALRTSDHDGLVVFIAAPSEIFADGFESGDTSAWGTTVD
jgi:predicted extracellular nuclease